MGILVMVLVFGMTVFGCDNGANSVPVNEVSINKESTNIVVGDEETLVAEITPDNATNQDVIWSSSDQTVASVSSDGIVTGVSEGTVTITVTTADGGKMATCTVTVKSVYTVTYNINAADSGSAPVDQTAVSGSSITLPGGSGFSKDGYTFSGWNTKADSTGTNYNAESSYTVNSNVTLYAKWTAITFTVTFDKNTTDTIVDPNPATKTVTFGEAYGALASVSRTGYTFGGWYTEAEDGTVVATATTVSEPADHTLYAKWTVISRTVTFNKNTTDAVGGPNPATKTVTFGEAYGVLPLVARTGYTFDGWYTETEDGSLVTITTTVSETANHILYAHWSKKTFTVTFDKNTADTTTDPDPATKTVTFDEIYDTLATVSRAGYNFIGWYTEAEGGTRVWATTTVNAVADHTLYARWIIDGSEAIGTTGPGGGKIFYYSSTGFNVWWTIDTTNYGAECHYLEVAPAGWYSQTAPNDPQLTWAPTGSSTYSTNMIGARGEGIGSGRGNSATIISGSNPSTNAPAAYACTSYRGGGLADWFLPSKYELNTLYENRASVGFPSSGWYWSSSQDPNIATKAWGRNFYDGGGVQSTYEGKNYRFYVRPIRAF
jgi:uncharacterized repeat protein (TIGR02543 family)